MPELRYKGFTRHDVLPAALCVATLAIAAVLFRFFMVPYSLQVNFDEGSEAAAVERVISGRWLPYVDAAAVRGPFLYWTQGLFQVLTGRFEFTGTRVLALVCALVVVATTFLGAWAAGWPLAGAIGGVVYIFVIAIVYAPGGGMGVVAESVAIAYLTTAFFLVAYGLYRARTERRRMILLALGGAVVGMGVLSKQTVVFVCAPMLLWIFARSLGESNGTSSPNASWATVLRRRIVPFGAGGVALGALVLFRYAIAGELSTFFYWSMSFGAKIYMQPFKGQVLKLMSDWFFGEPWAILGVSLALVTGVGRPLASLAWSVPEGLRESAFELAVGLIAVALLVGAAMPLRIWPHYFMTVYPFFGVTLGILIERLLRRGAIVPWMAQSVVVLTMGGLLIALGLNRLHDLNAQRKGGSWPNPRPDPACAEIDRLAGPGKEPIFVWGTAGDLYITCRRPSVSMFTSTMAVAGIIPPSWTPDPERVAPGIREKVLGELTDHPPPVILDHPMAAGATIMDFPIFADFVRQRYCAVSSVGDGRGRSMSFYARKDLDACSKH